MIHVSLSSRVPKSSHMSDIPADTCLLKAVMSFDFTPQIGQCAYYSHTELGMCECVVASRVMEMHMSVVTCSAINLRRLSKYKLLARQKRMICSVSAGNKLKKPVWIANWFRLVNIHWPAACPVGKPAWRFWLIKLVLLVTLVWWSRVWSLIKQPD